jgi:hypothetical protein
VGRTGTKNIRFTKIRKNGVRIGKIDQEKLDCPSSNTLKAASGGLEGAGSKEQILTGPQFD